MVSISPLALCRNARKAEDAAIFGSNSLYRQKLLLLKTDQKISPTSAVGLL